jgi:quercetin dioxygenase-like cupin family protein
MSPRRAASHVGRIDWTFADRPLDTPTAHGLARSLIVGPDQGAIHSDAAVGALTPGGWIARHVHSVEEALYVLEGELLLELDGHVHRLQGGHVALIPIGTWHTLANAGSIPVRWFSINTPQRLDPAAGRPDTIYEPAGPDLAAMTAAARDPSPGDPTSRWIGRDAGTPLLGEPAGPARGRAPAGMDSAVLAYSGIAVKMLVDRGLGADLLTMFTVDYEPNGAAQVHDHPFEEVYLFLEGEIEAELEGQRLTARAGDVLFAGVGASHGFFNTSGAPVRWIETQAPQPPARHAYRWIETWRALAARR